MNEMKSDHNSEQMPSSTVASLSGDPIQGKAPHRHSAACSHAHGEAQPKPGKGRLSLPTGESAPWNWDKIGIGLSSLCMVHCFLTPIVIALMPAFDGYLHSTVFHALMAILILPTALFAFVHGYVQHRIRHALVLGVIGVVVIMAALLLPEAIVDQVGHIRMTMVGSVFLMAGHVLNFRACRHGH